MIGDADRILLAVASGLVLATSGASGQETDETSCTLRWESLTDSTASRSIETGPDRYRHHVWDGMRWFCGGAVMTADSAVQYPGDRVTMVGSVDYRDSVRTLSARRLTYYQASDLIEARDSVRLVRRATGSTLEAPAVDFYRAGTGTIRQTEATGGTRMTVYPPDDTAGETAPYDVTSREATIFGNDVTIARGDVVITREDFRGTGDRARFDPDGNGLITGDPVLTGQDYRLTGDSIRTVGSEGRLERVRASGSGHLESEGMDVRAPEIRIRLVEGAVRDLWAHGGDARSRSASRVMLGDSLHIAFRGEQPDSITAVGEAAALELDPGETPFGAGGLGLDEGQAARPDSLAAGPDSLAAEPDSVAGVAGAGTPDTATGTGQKLFITDRDWIRGDTVRARFGRSGADSAGADAGAPEAAAPGNESTLQELTALGSARAYYRVTRDTVRDLRGRNYLIGREIVVEFREGDPYRVLGLQAIGVYLEPAGPGGASVPGPIGPPGTGGGPAPADTGGAAPRTPPDTSTASDTATATADTATAASDTTAGSGP